MKMNAGQRVRMHMVVAGVWAVLLIPTLILWKESILWIAFMSLYANFSTHWGAYQGAKSAEEAKKAAENNN